MKLLLDTHTALWMVNEHEKLSANARIMLLDDANAIYISIVSLWEIAIKASMGKLLLNGGIAAFIAKLNNMPIELLPITPFQVEIIENLPFIHRDPFDRMIVATAKAEGLTILTADENIHKYDVLSIW
jgi:PIN domain nuclease of toxin-antitoxin system